MISWLGQVSDELAKSTDVLVVVENGLRRVEYVMWGKGLAPSCDDTAFLRFEVDSSCKNCFRTQAVTRLRHCGEFVGSRALCNEHQRCYRTRSKVGFPKKSEGGPANLRGTNAEFLVRLRFFFLWGTTRVLPMKPEM